MVEEMLFGGCVAVCHAAQQFCNVTASRHSDLFGQPLDHQLLQIVAAIAFLPRTVLNCGILTLSDLFRKDITSMPTQTNTADSSPPTPFGDRYYHNGREVRLQKHETDFLVPTAQIPSLQIASARDAEPVRMGSCRPVNAKLSRCSVARERIEFTMDRARTATLGSAADRVAFHVYRLADSPSEELLFTGELLITLKAGDGAVINGLADKYRLRSMGTLGPSYLMEVTAETGMNCIKAANLIRGEDSVSEASPFPCAGSFPSLPSSCGISGT